MSSEHHLVDRVTTRVQEVMADALAELEEAREEAQEDAFDRDELLDVAAERDHLAAELELTQTKLAALKARVAELDREDPKEEHAKVKPSKGWGGKRRELF